MLPAAEEHAELLRKNNFALLTVNGDRDHPAGFNPLENVLQPLGIPHRIVVLRDTDHNLGKYYERAGDTMLKFLAERLTAPGEQPSGRAGTTAADE